MRFAFIQEMEGFPKCEIPQDVKCSEVEPFCDIYLALEGAGNLVVHPCDEQVTVVVDQRLLLSERKFGESMTEKFPHSSVIFIVRDYGSN